MSYTEWIVASGTTLIGAVAGLCGTYAVLRRRALSGDLLAHAALPGLCLAFLLLGRRSMGAMMLGAFLSGLLGLGLVSLLCRWTRTKPDAAMGIVLSVFFGGGIVLSSIIQHRPGVGTSAGLDSYIFGQAGAMLRTDVYLIAAVACVAILVPVACHKEFLLLSFDPAFARSQGWPTGLLDVVLMGILALVTVVALPAVGVVLTAALLILPGATARFWTHRLGHMLALAVVIGAITGGGGTLIASGRLDDLLGFDPFAFGDTSKGLPPGPVIVLFGTSLFLGSMLLAPGRGILARMVAGRHLRRKTARENLLRSIYELAESDSPPDAWPTVSLESLRGLRSWTPQATHRLVSRAARVGLVERVETGVRLTEFGHEEAARLVRNHRLWELYLIRGVDIAADHVHRDAEELEHLLTPEMLARLEEELIATGYTSESPDGVPRSPHDIHSLDA